MILASLLGDLAAGGAVLVSGVTAGFTAWHARRLQGRQQAHELHVSEIESRIQQQIADLTAEGLELERSRRRDELAKAATADLSVGLEAPYCGRVDIVIKNRGPAIAKDVVLEPVERIDLQAPNPTGRLPELMPPGLPAENVIRPGSTSRAAIQLFGGEGVVVDVSWTDGRSERQTERFSPAFDI